MIFLLTSEQHWLAAGDVVAVPGDDGFVHCCDQRQIDDVRRRYFPPDEDVVALALDPTLLHAETRYEPGAGGEAERFPHVYGSVLRSSVTDARRA